jgi:hypothetical protein
MTLQETLAKLNWGGEGYAAYDGYCYMTGPETTAWNQLGYELSNMNNWMNLQFREQQGLLNNFLIPQLESFVNNPPGFGATALASMRSGLIGNIGSQLSSQVGNLQNQFATQNMAGLGSGPEAALVAAARQTAAGQEAQGLNTINIQNAQEQAQQREFGLSGLQGAEQALGQLPQSAQLAANLTGMEGQQAKSFYGQQSPTSGILGGILGALGPLATMIPGIGPILGPIMSAVGGGISGAGGGGGGSSPFAGMFQQPGGGDAAWNTPNPGAYNVNPNPLPTVGPNSPLSGIPAQFPGGIFAGLPGFS